MIVRPISYDDPPKTGKAFGCFHLVCATLMESANHSIALAHAQIDEHRNGKGNGLAAA